MTAAITPVRRDVSVRTAVAVACLIGAQFLHWSVIDAHAREWATAGTFFFALALAEGVLAVLLLVHQRPWVAATAVAVSAVPVLIWTWDRSIGLPFGPTAGIRGTLGRSDVLSVVFEAMTIIALAPLLRRSSDQGTRPISLVGRIVIVAMCAYVAAFSYWSIFGDLARTHLR
jgi:hypothetical protein